MSNVEEVKRQADWAMESLGDFCARTKSSSTAKQISNKERAHLIKPPATHKREKKFFYVWLYVFFKLHDLSWIVSCVPIEILFIKKKFSCTVRTRWHQQQMPVGCVVHPIVNWRARRAEDNSIHSATSFRSLSFNHFSKRIKSSRLQYWNQQPCN